MTVCHGAWEAVVGRVEQTMHPHFLIPESVVHHFHCPGQVDRSSVDEHELLPRVAPHTSIRLGHIPGQERAIGLSKR